MVACAEVIRLADRMRDRSNSASRPIHSAFDLRQYTLPALEELLESCAREPYGRNLAQIEEVLNELEQRHDRIVSAMTDLDAHTEDGFWRRSPFREPFTELARTTSAHIARLIAEAQVLRARRCGHISPKFNAS